jgi:hypothetical protein
MNYLNMKRLYERVKTVRYVSLMMFFVALGMSAIGITKEISALLYTSIGLMGSLLPWIVSEILYPIKKEDRSLL